MLSLIARKRSSIAQLLREVKACLCTENLAFWMWSLFSQMYQNMPWYADRSAR